MAIYDIVLIKDIPTNHPGKTGKTTKTALIPHPDNKLEFPVNFRQI